jgi:transaldolase
MSENPLIQLHSLGQSVWQDFIRRDMLAPGGKMQQLIERDGLMGVTSNPAIFEKAIDGSPAYDQDIRALAKEGRSVEEIYETMTVADVARCADLFRGVHDKTGGRDGFVSLEVSARVANDTADTLVEARRLWSRLNRPNVFIKVPATPAGVPAIAQLIREGINVNVTLLFGLQRYEEVADAYIAGLEQRAGSGESIGRIASVASFFLSRMDTLLDPRLAAIAAGDGAKAAKARNLQGKIAVASAKQAYQIYKHMFSSERWKKLAERGAGTQRLLWASTSTKNKAYSDVMYVEALIGPETINTMTPETIDAYRDHGTPAARLEEGATEAAAQLKQLAEMGIDLAAATQELEHEGIKKFVEPFDKLIATLQAKIAACKG